MKNILNKFRIDSSTYILILFGLLSGYIKDIFIILSIVLVHEIGHVFFFLLFKIDIISIVIYPFGGVSKVYKKIHERIYKDILISLGGILFQIIYLIIIWFIYSRGYIVSRTYYLYIMYSISIIIFNLIPMVPLDGSKLLFSILSKYFSYKVSYIVMVVVSVLCLILFIMFNFKYKVNDIVVCLFLIISVVNVIKEYKLVRRKFYLERLLYDNYYNEIIYDSSVDRMRVDKYYYFKYNNSYLNEKKYIEGIMGKF